MSQDFGDYVRVAVPSEPIDEIPATPRRPDAEGADRQASDEEWQRERWIELGCRNGKTKRKRPKRDVCKHLPPQIA